MKIRIYITVTVLSLIALAIGSCSGVETVPETTERIDTNFRFLISDDVNAIDEFSSINVTISSIGLQQGGESGNWTAIEPDITEVDLKPLDGDNAQEIWSGNLMPGEYGKVFIHVTQVEGTLVDELGGGLANVKLPSEKLQISIPFTVSENGTTSFVYDITVVKAGQSGQYILQPQLGESGADHEFNEVEKQNNIDKQPEETNERVKSDYIGTIEEIGDGIWSVTIEGKSMTVDVSGAEINGDPSEGLQVKIEGYEEDGDIIAKEVEIEEAVIEDEEGQE